MSHATVRHVTYHWKTFDWILKYFWTDLNLLTWMLKLYLTIAIVRVVIWLGLVLKNLRLAILLRICLEWLETWLRFLMTTTDTSYNKHFKKLTQLKQQFYNWAPVNHLLAGTETHYIPVTCLYFFRYQNVERSWVLMFAGWTVKQAAGRWKLSCQPSGATTAWQFWAASSSLLAAAHPGIMAETLLVTCYTDMTPVTTSGPGYCTKEPVPPKSDTFCLQRQGILPFCSY